MKVWIINPFDNLPVEGYRPQRYWLMAEEFSAAGHDVVLWTQNWSHAKKLKREELPSFSSFELKYVSVPGYSKNISIGLFAAGSRSIIALISSFNKLNTNINSDNDLF